MTEQDPDRQIDRRPDRQQKTDLLENAVNNAQTVINLTSHVDQFCLIKTYTHLTDVPVRMGSTERSCGLSRRD